MKNNNKKKGQEGLGEGKLDKEEGIRTKDREKTVNWKIKMEKNYRKSKEMSWRSNKN